MQLVDKALLGFLINLYKLLNTKQAKLKEIVRISNFTHKTY